METAVTPDALSTREVMSDPYPVYSQLRSRSPFHYIHAPAGSVPGIEGPLWGWAFMKYADVYRALSDHETFSSANNPLVGKALPPLALIFDDPPRHTRFRRLVNKAFTPKRIEALMPWITSVANELLDTTALGEIDIVQHYTVPMPIKVIARLLGLPGEDYETFKSWSDALLSIVSMDHVRRWRKIEEMVRYFGKIAAARRAQGAEDLISALVAEPVEGEKLEEWEILGLCMLVLIAGAATTNSLLANLLDLLSLRPGLWQRLRADRSLVEIVIEEVLRFESPLQRFYRMTTREVEVSGALIPAGDLVIIYFGAANRDPEEFPNPDEFRLDRGRHNHLAFGTGIHHCMGAPLARAEAAVSLNAFLDWLSAIRPGQAPALRQTMTPILLGFEQLPLVLESVVD